MGTTGIGGADSGGAVIWVTGLAEAGKTTVARELVRQLVQRGRQPILLDGNEVRTALDMMTHGFDRESRIKTSMTYARLSQLLAEQGHLVVVATISLFHEVQRHNRENQPDYFEVLLDVPVEELKRRDSKGVYSGNDAKDVVGIGQSAEFPTHPDLVVTNYGDVDPKAAATMIRLAHEERVPSAAA
ncbi:adenylyl-sulfate kinase [Streptomyces sp. NPDC050732]|uniref:adenylyl-sulfate kinase n=1 Tax=Streptomyces sp. NPDC050732 TaxID=3154632 RepID=UPI0034406A34